MQMLAIDIGMGTQDILLYDSEKRMENCYKMVLPSPTYYLAQKVKAASEKTNNLLLTGRVMGGGHVSRAVKKHLQRGGRVYATADAALTLHDNLEVVRKMGVEIIDSIDNIEGEVVQLGDVNLEQLKSLFDLYDITLPENIAVAVQDHGFAPQMSNRMRRFEIFEEMMRKGGKLEDFAYTMPPSELNRMRAVADAISNSGYKPLLMDTGPAAICGALLDPRAQQPAMVINVGNGHTLGAVVKDGCIVALFEHHTSKLDAEKIDDYTRRLLEGNLEFEEVFSDGGHGCYIHEAVGFENIKRILVTGPNREVMKSSTLPLSFAVPFGDMMLSGCFGLVSTWMLKQHGVRL
jgi:uncharacterized protein (DUF1786 family)